MAPMLIIAAAGLKAAGELQEGEAAEAEGKSTQNIANQNAQVAEMEARAARQKAGFDQRRLAEAGGRKQGALIAGLGTAGGLGSQVAGDLIAAQAAETELEILMTGYEGELTATRAERQAELDRLQGRIYMKRGKQAKRASYYKAGSSVLKGFGSAGGGGTNPFGSGTQPFEP